MEIKLGGLILTAQDGLNKTTRIYIFKENPFGLPTTLISEVDSCELKAAVEALEKGCYRY